jgi:hypothetical protein
MTLGYRWRCFSCDAPNAASATSCSACGFPAIATGTEIARAQAARRMGGAPLPTPGPDRPRARSVGQTMAGLRGWQMGVGVGGLVLLAIGAYAGMDLQSWRGLGVSVFALIFGLIMLMVAWGARNDTPAM